MDNKMFKTKILTTPVWDNNNIENSNNKTRALGRNSVMHALNGNLKYKKIKVIQINKGMADLISKNYLIMFVSKEPKSDITFISEANYRFDDPGSQVSLNKATKGFHSEVSRQSTNGNSRAIMLINKKIPYSRLKD